MLVINYNEEQEMKEKIIFYTKIAIEKEKILKKNQDKIFKKNQEEQQKKINEIFYLTTIYKDIIFYNEDIINCEEKIKSLKQKKDVLTYIEIINKLEQSNKSIIEMRNKLPELEQKISDELEKNKLPNDFINTLKKIRDEYYQLCSEYDEHIFNYESGEHEYICDGCDTYEGFYTISHLDKIIEKKKNLRTEYNNIIDILRNITDLNSYSFL